MVSGANYAVLCKCAGNAFVRESALKIAPNNGDFTNLHPEGEAYTLIETTLAGEASQIARAFTMEMIVHVIA